LAIPEVKTTAGASGAPRPMPEARSITPGALGLAVFVSLAGGAATLLAAPRPVVPRELPALRLGEGEVARVVKADAELAAAAPDDERTRSLEEAMAEHNAAETGEPEPREVAQERVERLHVAAAAVLRAHGLRGLLGVRARAVLAMERARKTARGAELDRIVGRFPSVLERYGVTVGGRLRAPWFVARTLFKARFSTLCGRDPTEAFARVELRAYHGWLALEARSAPPAARAEAARRYLDAGGGHGDELMAALAWEFGEADVAEERYGVAFARTGSLRLRNHALAARVARREEDASHAGSASR
jgi:hypothetical protein